MAELRKDLSGFGLTMIAIGSCIGAGIFMTPAQVASELPIPFWIIIVWAAGGLVALTGALTFAELGGLFPKAGGVYVFLKEAYGDFVAFLYGFAILLVITSGALAALAEGFAQYAQYFFNLDPRSVKIIGIASLAFLTIINILGVKLGEIVINIVTSTKLLGIAGVILVGLAIALPDPHPVDFSPATTQTNMLTAFFLAFIGVFFSYGGWHHASYLAAEVQNPQRNVPRAMIIGTLVVSVTYILTNLAYLYMLPVDELAASTAVASDGLGRYFNIGGKLIALLIMISVFGTIAIYTMTAPRIYFAMAKDKVFFPQLARVHPRFNTPYIAILVQSAWAILLLLFWNTFEDMITYVVFMDLIFMALAAISIFIFRKKKSEEARPYRTIAYPVVPAIYIIINIIFIFNTLIQKPVQAWAGIIVVTIGFGFYFYFKNRLK
jgi:APA family basic amino acid/polyamine antiporter